MNHHALFAGDVENVDFYTAMRLAGVITKTFWSPLEPKQVLVAADGVQSRVRRQRLPEARVSDTGARCLYGKTRLTPQALSLVPPTLFDGFTAVIGG